MDRTEKALPPTSYLHQNIRILRRRLGFSQEELARRIGLNRGNIASYENGSAEPRICNLIKLSNLFTVSLSDLTGADLSCEDRLQLALSPEPKVPSDTPYQTSFEELIQQAEELATVMKSLHACGCYKMRNLHGEVPKDIQMVFMHFEELFATGQKLYEQHLDLLRAIANWHDQH